MKLASRVRRVSGQNVEKLVMDKPVHSFAAVSHEVKQFEADGYGRCI